MISETGVNEYNEHSFPFPRRGSQPWSVNMRNLARYLGWDIRPDEWSRVDLPDNVGRGKSHQIETVQTRKLIFMQLVQIP